MLRRRPDGYARRRALLHSRRRSAIPPATSRRSSWPIASRRSMPARPWPTLAPAAADGMMGPDADPAGRALFIEDYAAVPAATYRAAVQCLVDFRRARQPAAHQGAGALPRGRARPQRARRRWWSGWPARFPARYYVCLPGLGHMPNLEAPAAFDAAIFNFLDHALAATRLIACAHEPLDHRHARPRRADLRAATRSGSATRKPR